MSFDIPAITPPQRVLLGPGPSDVPPRVLSALAAPTIGHLDPQYLRIMDETRSMIREVFSTTNEMTMATSGTGSAGMEMCVVNLIEPGDEMIVCVNGVFGTRMRDVAERAGPPSTPSSRTGARSSSPRPFRRRWSNTQEPRSWESSTPRPPPVPTSRWSRSPSWFTTPAHCSSSTQ